MSGKTITTTEAEGDAYMHGWFDAREAITKEMVDRFLCWPLPKTFAPDCGISFKKPDHPSLWPVGTNLFTADESKQMILHLLGEKK